MGRMGRPSANIVLNPDERRELERITRSHSAESRMILRSKIVLRCDEGMTNGEIAVSLGIGRDTASKWRIRFSRKGMEGLKDAERPGKPPRITPEDRLRILDTVVNPPGSTTHWSLRDLSSELGRLGVMIGKSELQKILGELDLKPHQHRMWLHSSDPDFESKQADVIGLYMNPPKNALVISVDEKTQMQALSHEYGKAMVPGHPDHVDSHYRRHGVLSLFAALFVHRGTVIGRTEEKHTHVEFISFLELIHSETGKKGDGMKEIHIICDNLGTHKTAEVEEWLSSHERFHLHFTPTHASWLNQVELWFGILQRKVIVRGEFESKENMAGKIMKFIEYYNRTGKPFQWTYTGKILTI